MQISLCHGASALQALQVLLPSIDVCYVIFCHLAHHLQLDLLLILFPVPLPTAPVHLLTTAL